MSRDIVSAVQSSISDNEDIICLSNDYTNSLYTPQQLQRLLKYEKKNFVF